MLSAKQEAICRALKNNEILIPLKKEEQSNQLMTFTARIMISSAKREDFLSPLYMCCPPVPSKANISVFFFF